MAEHPLCRNKGDGRWPSRAHEGPRSLRGPSVVHEFIAASAPEWTRPRAATEMAPYPGRRHALEPMNPILRSLAAQPMERHVAPVERLLRDPREVVMVGEKDDLGPA